MEQPIIAARQIQKSFRNGKIEVHALRGVDLAVAHGEMLRTKLALGRLDEQHLTIGLSHARLLILRPSPNEMATASRRCPATETAAQEIRMPPSTVRTWPVVRRDSSDARNKAALATSLGSLIPRR